MKSMIPAEVLELRWQRCHGAHPGMTAQYGPYFFRISRWQKGSYVASVTDEDRRNTLHYHGEEDGQLRTEADAKAKAAQWFRALREEDRANGIRRFA